MFKGVLKKMITEMGTPIRYFLNLDNDFIEIYLVALAKC